MGLMTHCVPEVGNSKCQELEKQERSHRELSSDGSLYHAAWNLQAKGISWGSGDNTGRAWRESSGPASAPSSIKGSIHSVPFFNPPR